MDPRKPADFLDLRVAIAGRRVVRFWWKGQEIEVEAHALLQAKRTQAFVLAGWQDGWRFYRYAEMRDLTLTDRFFERREDVPVRVPFSAPARPARTPSRRGRP